MIITANKIITGDGKTVLTNSAVYINIRGIIETVGTIEEVRDFGDATIMPGMFDMHAHLGYRYSQPDSFNYNDQMIMMYALQPDDNDVCSSACTGCIYKWYN